MRSCVTSNHDRPTDPHAREALKIAERLYHQQPVCGKGLTSRINYAARGGGDLRAALKITTKEVESCITSFRQRISCLLASANELRQLYDRIEAGTSCCQCGAELPRYWDGVAAYCPRCGQKQGNV